MFGKTFSVRTAGIDPTCEALGISRTFSIRSQLGSGGSGTVYKAWHKRLRKHVVIKEVRHSSTCGIKPRRNEVEALKNAKSVYLPQVLDFIIEGNNSFTVMEFIEGESLDKLLKRGQRFTKAQVTKWYRQLASALYEIHRQNVCHRDIKPANIMLTPSGDVCLIDFNAALVEGNDTRIISRSLGYASPEQYRLFKMLDSVSPEKTSQSSQRADENCFDDARTKLLESESITVFAKSNSKYQSTPPVLSSAFPVSRNIDWKLSDIYSLGATMYHFLTGKHPSELAKKALSISKSGSFNMGIMHVVRRSMRTDPNQRFASAEKLIKAINRYL